MLGAMYRHRTWCCTECGVQLSVARESPAGVGGAAHADRPRAGAVSAQDAVSRQAGRTVARKRWREGRFRGLRPRILIGRTAVHRAALHSALTESPFVRASRGKGSSGWDYAAVPIVGPILGAALAGAAVILTGI